MSDSVPALMPESPKNELDNLECQQVQVIDENQKFNPELEKAFDHPWDLQRSGFNYHVVSVFGSQSTGKSTLLNRLFGTEFAVMNEAARSQTTKGIWMSRGRDSNILVLDVEGTDGQERGEDQDFERKSALFSLAISEVLIINMWENSVGLYNGANMGLLKVVLEVNLQLFQRKGSPKTCLFFILRDFTGVTPLEALSKTLKHNLERIWESISKPEGRQDAALSDFFDLQFFGLHHKVYAPDRFEEGAVIVRNKFYNETDAENFLFKSKYHRGIPADGFSKFSSDIWDTIISNRDLDLPSQQELLAQYRCDEIAKSSFAEFQTKFKPIRSSADSGNLIPNFGKTASTMIDSIMTRFDTEAGRYAKPIYERVRHDLLGRFHSTLFVVFTQQLRLLHKSCITHFENVFIEASQKQENDFAANLRSSRLNAVDKFTKGIQESTVPDAEWSHDEALKEFLGEIERISQRKKEDAFGKLKLQLEKQVKKNLSEPLSLLFADVQDDIWTKALAALNDTIASSSDILVKRLRGLEASEGEVAKSIVELKMDTWKAFLAVCQTEVSENHLLDKIRKKFETHFRYDDRSLPRVWRPNDDVDTIFAKSKTEAETLLERLVKVEISPDDLDADIRNHPEYDASSLKLLGPLQTKTILDRFKREADVQFLEAKRSTVATTMNIPPWFIGLTILLGWNEIMAVLRNPFLTLILAMLLGSLYVIYYTNMGGPALQVAKATTTEIGRQIGNKLRERGIEPERVLSVTGIQRGIHEVSKAIQNATAPPPSPQRPKASAQSESIELTQRNVMKKPESPMKE